MAYSAVVTLTRWYGIIGSGEQKMPFTINEFEDLLQILQQHPEWRARLLDNLLGEEFLALPHQVQLLIQAQQRTDEQLAALTAEVRVLVESQKRLAEEFASYRLQTDQSIRELVESQKQLAEEFVAYRAQTDARFAELSETVRELAEAQKKLTEEFIAYRSSTDRRLDEISKELRNLAARVGMSLEEEAEDMVWWVLKQKGYRFAAGYRSARFDGEVDVVLIGETPEGESISVVIESKTRLGKGDVYAWAQRVQSDSFRLGMQAAGFSPPYLPYLFAMRPDPAAVEAAKESGIGLVNTRGEVVEGTLVIR
ncbi:MAG: hypothetical protein KatS3mg022_0392 [Armatimonadota bacterium]|nr:MAG: hypothetical protein KatS3mg022_0392 [Armatimonadota bacterium]